ncbi:MAG: hypothetical protein LBI03_02780, partial [Clostridiales bacterium]|nr:hypothetical protein [Clostridiales bacterium]
EFVVVLHDCPIAKEYKKLTNFDENVSVYNQVSELINGGMTKKDALKHFAQISGLKKNQLYSMFEKEKPDPD